MSNAKKPSPQAVKKLRLLLLSLVLTVTLYIVLRKASLYGVIDCLYIVLAVLFVVYFYMSFAFAKRLPEKDELNPAWDDVRKEKFLKQIRKNKAISVYLIYWLLPLMGVVAFDLVWRVFFAS